MESTLDFTGELSAVVYRANGRVENLGVIAGAIHPRVFGRSVSFWKRMWSFLRRDGALSLAVTFAAFLTGIVAQDPHVLQALVTAGGANYLASDFASGLASPRIGAFNYHDCGTGGVAGSTVSISGASNATPIVITTATPHGRTTNDLVAISGIAGNTAANGNWQITVLNSTTFSLVGSAGNGAYTSGGTVQLLNGAADTGLVTPYGGVRITGSQSTPAANKYRSQATITFSSSLTITEWALFSASASGTMWDRRWFNNFAAPNTTATGALASGGIAVNPSDAIAFDYNLTVNAGGS